MGNRGVLGKEEESYRGTGKAGVKKKGMEEGEEGLKQKRSKKEDPPVRMKTRRL